MKVTNQTSRLLTVNGTRQSRVVLVPGQTVELSEKDAELCKSSRGFTRWVESGLVEVGEPRKAPAPAPRRRASPALAEG